LGVHDAAEARFLPGSALDQPSLVRNDADGDAVDSAIGADHLAREVALKLVELSVIDDRSQHGVHVVRHAMVLREKVVQTAGLGTGNGEQGTESCALLAARSLCSPFPVPGSRPTRETI